MKILLYNPDNGVTRNFMPHLWMFLLQALTPPGHEVVLIDGNAQPMDEEGIARYVREQNIGLVGIGAMTRMIAKAYRMADAVRAAGVKVVMGGPHVTEMADEALGRDGGSRHADAVAALSGNSLGQNQAGAIQCASGIFASAPEARGGWMGNISDYPGGVRARLSLRMRVLYGDGILWRFHPLSHQ
jgi:hypothetical protein